MAGQPHAIIRRLVVRNYRSIAELDLDLGSLTVLIGPNGSGKSNIIDVFRFIRDSTIGDLDRAIHDRGGINAIRRWTSRGKKPDIEMRLYLQGSNWSGEYGFVLSSKSQGDYSVKSEHLVVRSSGQISEWEIRDRTWVTLPPSFDRSAMPPPPITMLILPRLAQIFQAEMGKMADFLSPMALYRIYPDAIRLPQPPLYSHPLLERGENLASTLHALQVDGESYGAFSEALQQLAQGITGFSVDPIGGYLVTKLHHDAAPLSGQGPSLALSQESDGTLRILAILAALYQRPAPPLLAIEEPEMGIHPGALAVLCDLIQEASLRGQVVISSHSPDIIDRFPIESFRIVEKEGGVTKVGLVSDVQRGVVADRLFSPGELMRSEGLWRDAEPSLAP